MSNNPIEKFEQWYQEVKDCSKVNIPSACCLSTNGLDEYPNARFVSLKGIINNSFIITGSQTSRKGFEIKNSDKVALTFWWPETEKQIRIQGTATKLSNKNADIYFSERNRESQILSIISNQGEELFNIEELIKAYDNFELTTKNTTLERPVNWGGYLIKPIRIEFLTFKSTRFHERILYEKQRNVWKIKKLKP
jgi:pyridoxamine 5'-phosphate oxidase